VICYLFIYYGIALLGCWLSYSRLLNTFVGREVDKTIMFIESLNRWTRDSKGAPKCPTSSYGGGAATSHQRGRYVLLHPVMVSLCTSSFCNFLRLLGYVDYMAVRFSSIGEEWLFSLSLSLSLSSIDDDAGLQLLKVFCRGTW
jgi:hypothetical protein